MADDPSYVRLANRLSRGMVADVQNSGWSIAGLDVRKFPDAKKNPEAARFVRKALNDGRLEAASKAEWEDVHDDDDFVNTVREQNPDFGRGPQEAQVQMAAEKARRKLESKRGDQREPEEVYDEEVRQPRKQRASSTGPLPDDLDDLSKAELQELAQRRGLAKSGSKDDLISRLEDSEDEDESEGENED